MAKKFLSDVGFEMQESDFEQLISESGTQAELMNRMIMELVNYYAIKA